MEGEWLSREADARLRLYILGECAIAFAPSAHNIEALQRKSGRIDLPVAGSAGRISAVAVELLANGDGAPDIGFESGDPRGWGGVETEDAFHDPDATHDRRRGGAVRGDLEDTRLSHDTAADRIFREGDLAHRDAGHSRNSIVVRQPLIEE